MIEDVKPLEEVDPELAKMFQDIANKRMNAVVRDGKVYEKLVYGLKEIRIDLPGRNDPCVCGSGKKFKKCCINKI